MPIPFDDLNKAILNVNQSIQELVKEDFSDSTIKELVNKLQENLSHLKDSNFNEKKLQLVSKEMTLSVIKAEERLSRDDQISTASGVETLKFWKQLITLRKDLEELDRVAIEKLRIGKKVDRKDSSYQA